MFSFFFFVFSCLIFRKKTFFFFYIKIYIVYSFQKNFLRNTWCIRIAEWNTLIGTMFFKPTDRVIVYWQRFIFDKIHRVNKRTVFTNTCLGLTYQPILSWESPYFHGAPKHLNSLDSLNCTYELKCSKLYNVLKFNWM